MNQISEEKLATTRISVTYELEPTENIVGDLSGLIGQFCDSFVGAFYPRVVSRKANVVVTELFNNAVAHNTDGNSRIRVSLGLVDGSMKVRVMSAATPDQADELKYRLAEMRDAADQRAMLAHTIRDRHARKLAGGLGLMRLVVENKFSLSSKYRDGELTMEAQLDLGGLT
jgi:hypothetical protein